MSISELMRIDFGRIERSGNLGIKLDSINYVQRTLTITQKILKFFSGGTAKFLYTIIKYKIYSDSGEIYSVLIETTPSFDSTRFRKNKIKIVCNCADFKYRVAYGLNLHNALYYNDNILKVLTKEAITIPPTKVTTSNLCKHCYRAILDLERNHSKYDLLVQ